MTQNQGHFQHGDGKTILKLLLTAHQASIEARWAELQVLREMVTENQRGVAAQIGEAAHEAFLQEETDSLSPQEAAFLRLVVEDPERFYAILEPMMAARGTGTSGTTS